MACSVNAAEQACALPSDSVASVDPDRNSFVGLLLSRLIDGEGTTGGSTVQKLISSAGEIANTNAMPLAKNLGGILAVLSILFAAIFAAINRESIGGAVIEVLIKAAVVGGVLTLYGPIVIGGFSELQSALTSVSGSPNVGHILENFLTTIVRSLYLPFKTAYAAIGCSGFWSITFGMFIDVGVAFFVLLFGAFIIIYALLQAIFGLLMGPFILAIALAVGPISIACAVNGVTESAFGKWLGFAIHGAVMTGIAGIVLRITAESIVIAGVNNEIGGTLAASISNLVHLLVASKLFSHIPDFAGALSPHGGAGVKGGGKLDGTAAMVLAVPAAIKAGKIGALGGFDQARAADKSGKPAHGKAMATVLGSIAASSTAMTRLKEAARGVSPKPAPPPSKDPFS